MQEIFPIFAEHVASYGLEIQCAMSGMPDAKVVIIGEYPAEQDALMNTPFSGAAGKTLFNSLRAVGISRNDCYCTNLIKRRVTAKAGVPQMEYELWKEALEWELKQLTGTKVIIALGNSVLNALFGVDGITHHRGSVYDYNDCKVVVANSPAIVVRDPSQEIVLMMDMDKAAKVLRGDFVPHVINVHINPTFDDAMNYIALCRENKRVAIDIEVIGGETACIGLAYKPDEAMCINFRDRHQNYFTAAEEQIILRAFLAMCDDTTVVTITQNGNFDSYFMGFKDHAKFTVRFDTLLAHHTLYPKLPHSLAFLTAQYTTHPYYKDDKLAFHEGGDLDAFWTYNGKDAAITFACATKLEEELKEQNLYHFFTTHVMRLHPHLVESTVDGVLIDTARKEQLRETLTREVTEAYTKFSHAVAAATGDHELIVNPSSPKQLVDLFYKRLGCKHNTGSTAAPVREGWLKDPRTSERVKEVIVALNAYAEAHKFFSTYVESKVDHDNRFRCEWRQFGTQSAPGRLSSAQVLWGSGGNLQNQPEKARSMFIADPGLVWFSFDLGQAEARYVGWDANIEAWMEDFERARLSTSGDKFDAHRSLASSMFNIPYNEVPKKDILDAMGRYPGQDSFDETTAEFTMRYIAKRCRHGLNYRMQYPRLAQTTGLPLGEAQKNYYIYHRTTPELKIWWKKLEETVKRKRELYNSLGRRLRFFERLDDEDALSSIVAFRPQSTIGDKVSQIWYQAHEDPRWDHSRAKIRINVHDALYGVSTPSFVMKAMSILKAYAETPIMVTSIVTNKTTPLIIPADFKMSKPGVINNMSNLMEVEVEAARL